MPQATAVHSVDSLREALTRHGFAFAPGITVQQLLRSFAPLSDWESFAASWTNLALDRYMADGGRYRRRRYAAYEVTLDGSIARRPHQPHYQALDYNPLNGGIARWFDPILPVVGSGPSMNAILRFGHSLFDSISRSPRGWNVEVHQFRIEARADEQGRPTPEGMHRDGVDFALVLLIGRSNVARGTTSIQALDGERLGTFTLTDPFDAAIVDDARVCHGVTLVEPIDPGRPASRDVLVVTFAKKV